MEVEGKSPCDNKQGFKPNLHKSQEQVRWESVIVQQRHVHDLPHCSTMVELFDEVKADSHL